MSSPLFITIGTGSLGGIDSVIKGYLDSGIFEKKNHIRIVSHMGEGKFYDFILFVKSICSLLTYSVFNKKLILHCHMSYKGSFWRKFVFLIISKMFGNKSIIHLHGSEFKDYYSSRNFLVKKCVKWLIVNCDYFIVLSNSWSDYIYSISGRNVFILNNFVDIEKIDCERNKRDIVFLGAFIPRKGIYDLINACALLNIDFHLHLCGRGEDKKVYQLISKLNLLEKVTFHGWVDTEKKITLLSSCGVMILPSFNEGLPMTIIESMACCIPIITTPVGAIPEVITDGFSGFLVEPGNVDDIKRMLEHVLSCPSDLVNIVNNANSIYTLNYSSSKIIPKLESIYEIAVNSFN